MQQINHRSQLMSPVTAPCDCPVIIPLIITIIIIIISLLQFITPELKKGWYNGLSVSYPIYWLVGGWRPCYFLFSPLNESFWADSQASWPHLTFIQCCKNKKVFVPSRMPCFCSFYHTKSFQIIKIIWTLDKDNLIKEKMEVLMKKWWFHFWREKNLSKSTWTYVKK